ncbi:3-dehydroquinate synthase [Anaeromyxobacter dehalogenans 2CP-1]|uniref:3-dehydroquinate synthase n=1 Tax=Anaeromyxobacter dehalogenans (strain ATCC BAA-258 / DSM 21875 / 2CP-1) TaxID=455488 RepID=B8J8X1_ANAD2|nr:3-dehydroquinate synthase family protein [Anaeromyxobacter dehalogenans]ACL63569.1 3-dehydroquinate synthase [Anaeromyxobacter dehalogenans 2CP-1]
MSRTRKPAAAEEAGAAVTEIIPARQGDHAYEVRVGAGAAAALPALADEHDAVALVSCRRVLSIPFGKDVLARLRREAPLALVHALPDGEAGKTLAELERAAAKLLRAGATRRTLVVALGGGAVSDAAGFLAATYMRGVPWVAVPTTLLAMVDAAIGGKTAVNLPAAKNAVGAFHPPDAVLADPAALRTLPRRELASGLGEVLKYGALQPALLDAFAALGAAAPDPAVIATCARMKVDVVAEDPTEHGPRKLLNLGHTFGHGVEAAGRFSRYTHGEAVAVGLAFAFRLAARMGRVDGAAVERVEAAVAGAGLPVRVPPAIARAAARLMAYDKKRAAGGLRWVLPAAVEDGWRVEWDVEAEPAAVEAAVAEISEARAGGRAGRRTR